MSLPTSVAVLIVAAGRGSRAGSSAGPKQYQTLGAASVLAHTLEAFAGHPDVGDIVVVIHPDDCQLYEQAARRFAGRLLPPALGAATRQGSVHAGLQALSSRQPGHVLIHDAARPFVDRATIDRVVAGLARHAGAIAAIPLADTLKRQTPEGTVSATLERTGLWRAQTPQGFQFASIMTAHAKAAIAQRSDFTDDSALAEWAGLDIALTMGAEANIKLTTQEDLIMAARAAQSSVPNDEVRMATGFDVHRFKAGDHVWLCGVKIPHTAALDGHSDADVGLHALTDALLGTIADGDIGQHFPPSDPQWRGAASHMFLADTARRVRARGGTIVHCDITLLCEAPKISPHRDQMRARVAEILAIPLDGVSVKATTTEGLGFTGRREGIAAQAAATIRLPRLNG
jgi:2-C-methyl-D-erythritol 4-phosphate cytidylyltransferase / 2-C-methyl-D-erythritol 2,4-cyclodiphosphate synthase